MGVGQGVVGRNFSRRDARLSRRPLGRLAIGRRRRDLDAFGKAAARARAGGFGRANLAERLRPGDLAGQQRHRLCRDRRRRALAGPERGVSLDRRRSDMDPRRAGAENRQPFPDQPTRPSARRRESHLRRRRLFHMVQLDRRRPVEADHPDALQRQRSRLARRDRSDRRGRTLGLCGGDTGVVFARRRRHMERRPGGEIEGPDARPDEVRRLRRGALARRQSDRPAHRLSHANRLLGLERQLHRVPADPVLDAARADAGHSERADRQRRQFHRFARDAGQSVLPDLVGPPDRMHRPQPTVRDEPMDAHRGRPLSRRSSFARAHPGFLPGDRLRKPIEPGPGDSRQ